MKADYFNQKIAVSEKEIVLLRQRFNIISWIRLAVAFIVFVCFVLGYQTKEAGILLIGIAGILIFVILANYHELLKRKQDYFNALKAVSGRYLSRLTNDWRNFQECGTEYLSEQYPQAVDLNLFGKDSLFQYLCTANTGYGKNCLAKKMKNIVPDKKAIEESQQAVLELSKKKELALQIEALGRQMRAENKKDQKQQNVFADFIKTTQKVKNNISFFMKAVIWVLPVITILSIVGAVLKQDNKKFIIVSIGLIFFQWFLAIIGAGKNVSMLKPIFSFYSEIEGYIQIFSAIEEETFESEYLLKIQCKVKKENGAVKGLRELDKIGEAVKTRFNLIAYLLCNGILMWDYHCVNRFHKWIKKYGPNIEEWFEAIGQIEAHISLAVLCHIKDNAIFPTISENNVPEIVFHDMKHPLLLETTAIGNDFDEKGGLCVITGSNMSGKTTFLRGIGINLVLAYAGGPVNAKMFSVSEMTVFTSMKIEDSVNNGISTFYAELLRMKEIVEYNKKLLPMIALIDEIFKGTNSKDRIIGAVETMKRLAKPSSLTIVTTHDFELCDLEKDKIVKASNYHFAEHYKGNQILFDYKINHGRCQTTNAQHLLRMVGIIQ